MNIGSAGFGLSGWLHVDSGVVSLPVSTSGSRLGGTGAYTTRNGARSFGDLGFAEPPVGYASGFSMAQNRAVETTDSAAASSLARASAFSLPPGDLIGLMQTARASNRADWTGRAERLTERGKYQARTANLAAAQINRSTALESGRTDNIAAGDYTYRLTVDNGDPIELTLTVDYDRASGDSDYNEVILERIGRQIEAASDRLTAGVVHTTKPDDNGNYVTQAVLEIASRQSGRGTTGFQLEDVSGNLVSGLKLNASYRTADDLKYVRGTAEATPYGPIKSDYYQTQLQDSVRLTNEYFTALTNPRISRSEDLDPDDQSDLAAGSYTYSLLAGGENYRLNLSIDYKGYPADDNEAVLTRMAWQINRAARGLEAKVIKGLAEDNDGMPAEAVSLVVTNRESGRDEDFRLLDLDGDLVNTLGLGRAYRAAEDLADAPAGRSGGRWPDHFFQDNNTLDTTAWRMTDAPSSLTVGPALKEAVSQVRKAISGHNRFMGALVKNDKYLQPTPGNNLRQDLNLIKTDLAEIGIGVGATGRVSAGPELDKAFNRNLPRTRERLTGDKGLLTTIEKNMSTALGGGMDQYRTRRPEMIYDSNTYTGPGWDGLAAREPTLGRPRPPLLRTLIQQPLLSQLI